MSGIFCRCALICMTDWSFGLTGNIINYNRTVYMTELEIQLKYIVKEKYEH